MSYITVTQPSELRTLLRHLESCSWIAIDTEFISEKKHRSQLCLIQIAAEGVLAIIDPIALEKVAPFWEFLVEHQHQTIVHAYRGEMEFCLRYTKKLPKKLFDVQLAAGLIGLDYPSSFSTLLERILQMTLPKGETRTDWSQRPLSIRQIDYALNDVRYLCPLAKKIRKQLQLLDRMSWYKDEIQKLLGNLTDENRTPKWHSLSGLGNLNLRELAVVRELWFWRDQRAAQVDIPAGYILRDDLLVELAKRKSCDPKRITAIRGMQRADLVREMPEIAAAIRRGLDCPDGEVPRTPEKNRLPQYTQMVQLVHSGLQMLCHQKQLALSIVASPSDVRELMAHRLGILPNPETLPQLMCGWRADVVGDFLENFLEGRIAIRFDKKNPKSPLKFVQISNSENDHFPLK